MDLTGKSREEVRGIARAYGVTGYGKMGSKALRTWLSEKIVHLEPPTPPSPVEIVLEGMSRGELRIEAKRFHIPRWGKMGPVALRQALAAAILGAYAEATKPLGVSETTGVAQPPVEVPVPISEATEAIPEIVAVAQQEDPEPAPVAPPVVKKKKKRVCKDHFRVPKVVDPDDIFADFEEEDSFRLRVSNPTLVNRYIQRANSTPLVTA